jgi:hypothetical protein
VAAWQIKVRWVIVGCLLSCRLASERLYLLVRGVDMPRARGQSTRPSDDNFQMEVFL